MLAQRLLGQQPGRRLQDRAQRLDELEFYFPVKRLRLRALQDLLHRYLPAEWTDIHAAIEKLKFNT